MCLAVPMRVVKIDKDTAVAEAGGIRRAIRVSLVSGVSVGDYVVVHAGFAIEKIDERRAKETLDALREIMLL